MKKGLCKICLPAVLLCALVAMASCSTRKNTAASRNYNAFITRYNIYYNGDTHFKETLQKMEQEAGAGKQSAVSKMFSSHPDTEARIKRMEEKATKDGIAKPENK